MPATTQPNTLDIGNAIVSYLTALTYQGNPRHTDGSQVFKLGQLEAVKDVTDQVTDGSVCVEVYGDLDTSERRGFGGRIWDTQSWFILALCSLDTAANAAQIYDVRDAIVQPFQKHAQMSNIVSNLFHSQLKDNGRFLRVERNAQFLRGYLAELISKQEWYIPGGIIS